jgi:uncharacterized 2Fe-2S/4Fe-4S cluster protein (DUF4445 family)
MIEHKIRFKPQNKSICVPKGTDLLTAAIKAGIMLHASCGGEGICGKCRVLIGKKEALACQTIIESDLEATVPKESVETPLGARHEAEEFTKGIVLEREGRFRRQPLVEKEHVELKAPTHDDNSSDLDRVYSALMHKIGGVHVSTNLANLKHLSEVLRDSDFKVTVTLAHKADALDMVSVEPGDTRKANYGFAFDIGTTTVAGQLIDLNTGSILGSRIAFNRQSAYGSDIITRIICASNADGLKKLSEAVLENINEIVADLAKSCNVNVSDIYAVVCAGNMTMMHLLLKVDPANIRKAPYIPTTTDFGAVTAPEAGIEIHPRGIVSFIDIGTNGEIVLGNSEWMIGAAASAGPAFEGSGLQCGMKATRGAIQTVEIDRSLDVRVSTIGGAKPGGICGSGYIDLLCQMLKNGIIGRDGKINREIKNKKIRKRENNYEFAVTGDIVITDDDIDNLKRSKGAIYSAIIALLNKVGKKLDDVKKIYIAGGFGNYLNIPNAVFIGLLPDAAPDRYEFIGNSSLAGARMSLLSREALAAAGPICRNITYIDLSSEPNYMDEYIASLFFPHTDMTRFPSVRL